MNIEQVPVDVLLHDPRNARKHDEDNLLSIERSLARFGQQKPIVVSQDDIVLAGNGTLAAAKRLGWATIGVVRSALSGDEAMAFAIADNRTAELARWDYEELAKQLQELDDSGYDTKNTGWSDEEINNLVGAAWQPAAVQGDLETSFTPNDNKATKQGSEGGAPRTVTFTPAQWAVVTAALGTGDDLADKLVGLVQGAGS